MGNELRPLGWIARCLLPILLFACGGSSAGGSDGELPPARSDALSGDVIPFKDGMTHPTLIRGAAPVYTPNAMDRCAAGAAVVRCVITVDGDLRHCRIVRSFGDMDESVLMALSTWVMTPALRDGKAVNVDYELAIQLRPPNFNPKAAEIAASGMPPPPTDPPPGGPAAPGGSDATAPEQGVSATQPSPSAGAPSAAPSAGAAGAPPAPPTPVNPTTAAVPFGKGMNRPLMICGRDPIYTREALAARAEGLAIIRCTINTEGRVTNCRVIKDIPIMRQTILDALYSRRYTPVYLGNMRVNVDYVFNIKLVLPQRHAPPP